MSKGVKMVKLEDGNYVPEECCSFARNFETNELEVDDVSMPCECDCSCGGVFENPCRDCTIQRIMNEYAEQKEKDWILTNERMPDERDSMFAKFKGTDKWKDGMFEKISQNVIVTVKYDNGERRTDVAHTVDGRWKLEIRILNAEVIAWKEMPEPYKEGKNVSNM